MSRYSELIINNPRISEVEVLRKCGNCGEPLKIGEKGHYIPACMGEEGFYFCDAKGSTL